MKTKRGSGVWYILSVNTVRKIAAAEASWLTLSSTLLFAELPDLRRSVRGSSNSWSPKFAYLVLRNARRPNVTSPDYLPNLLGSLDRDGNADSNTQPAMTCGAQMRASWAANVGPIMGLHPGSTLGPAVEAQTY